MKKYQVKVVYNYEVRQEVEAEDPSQAISLVMSAIREAPSSVADNTSETEFHVCEVNNSTPAPKDYEMFENILQRILSDENVANNYCFNLVNELARKYGEIRLVDFPYKDGENIAQEDYQNMIDTALEVSTPIHYGSCALLAVRYKDGELLFDVFPTDNETDKAEACVGLQCAKIYAEWKLVLLFMCNALKRQ